MISTGPLLYGGLQPQRSNLQTQPGHWGRQRGHALQNAAVDLLPHHTSEPQLFLGITDSKLAAPLKCHLLICNTYKLLYYGHGNRGLIILGSCGSLWRLPPHQYTLDEVVEHDIPCLCGSLLFLSGPPIVKSPTRHLPENLVLFLQPCSRDFPALFPLVVHVEAMLGVHLPVRLVHSTTTLLFGHPFTWSCPIVTPSYHGCHLAHPTFTVSPRTTFTLREEPAASSKNATNGNLAAE